MDAGIEQRLRGALSSAMKERDAVATGALRAVLGAIGNAGAVDAVLRPDRGPIAGAVRGLGAGEVMRRELTEDDVRAIVAAEIGEREAAGDEYEQLGQTDAAATIRAEARVLQALL